MKNFYQDDYMLLISVLDNIQFFLMLMVSSCY
jgi:hypothetical protein